MQLEEKLTSNQACGAYGHATARHPVAAAAAQLQGWSTNAACLLCETGCVIEGSRPVVGRVLRGFMRPQSDLQLRLQQYKAGAQLASLGHVDSLQAEAHVLLGCIHPSP